MDPEQKTEFDEEGAQFRTFASGARREDDSNKLHFELMPVGALNRIANHWTTGAYGIPGVKKGKGPGNWEKGMPTSAVWPSILRHVFQWAAGQVMYKLGIRTQYEDHLAAIVWNAMVIMENEERVRHGLADPELLDFPVERVVKYPPMTGEDPAVMDMTRLRPSPENKTVAGVDGRSIRSKVEEKAILPSERFRESCDDVP